ncbi:MAG TPA: hypothetical protein VF944_10450 [Candidatus Bathyarchaeia archaeon]
MPSEIIKKGFHDKTKALVEQAMKLLASSLQKGEEIPSRTAEAYKVIGPGGWSQDYESRLDYFGFVHDHEKDIEELPEFGMWLKELREDPVISKHVGELVGSRRGMLSRTAWDYLSHLLLAQISSGTLDFDLRMFELAYRQMEEFFHKETVEFRAFSPLQNFESDSGSISLGGGLMIRKTTNPELERLLDPRQGPSMVPHHEIITFKYAMELTYETEKVFGELPAYRPAPEDEVFSKLVSALRLFKPGTIGFNFIQEAPTNDAAMFGRATRSNLDYKHFWGPVYSLKGDEIAAFNSFWRAFSELDLAKLPLGIAINRFNFAFGRLGLEDKLIDFMIAFEALFFKTGEIGENRHKLSIRVAKLLARDYESRKRIAKEMAEFYGMRSGVVHGEQVHLKPEFTDKIEDYLRQSIKYFLDQQQAEDHDEIISRLDLE